MRYTLSALRLVSALSASVALVACDPDEAKIGVYYRSDKIVPASQTSVTLSDRQKSYVVQGAALLPNGNDNTFATAQSGEVTVDVSMADAQGSIASGHIALPLRPDWVWGVDVTVDSTNPTRLCLGCMGVRSFALRPGAGRTVRDSLWVVWGGNSIKNPVVY